MSIKALQRRAREARTWLKTACFPLWAETGLSRGGWFPDALLLNHRPPDMVDASISTQARAGQVFAQAAALGWEPERCGEICQTVMDALAGPARLANGLVVGPGPIDTGPIDTGNLSENANAPSLARTVLALKAWAAIAQALPDLQDRALGEADRAIEGLEAALRDTRGGGFLSTLPAPPTRDPRAHRHLLEASSTLARLQRGSGHAGRASELMGVFLTRLTRAADGRVPEMLGADWQTPPPDHPLTISPGEQFAWVAAICNHARLISAEIPQEAVALHAWSAGLRDDRGRLPDRVDPEGRVIDAGWSMTAEVHALRAALSLSAATGIPDLLEDIRHGFDRLMDGFLTFEGGWIAHYDGDGQPGVQDMPAEPGADLAATFAELIAFCET
jgi:mannose/cellobiose epimerase-like protein (N-acyl-D-glucosamine 2-epimerase family)